MSSRSNMLLALLVIAITLLAAALCACGGNSQDTAAGLPELAAIQGPSMDTVTLDQTLAELGVLPVPPAADKDVFELLKDELAKSLKATGVDRFSAAVPQSAVSAVDDLAVLANTDGTATFEFTYRNKGDYNQDSLVNITDLTPIGQNWEVASSSADWQVAQVADGNGDLLVNISDITAIGQNYQCSVQGYALCASATPVPGQNLQEVVRIAFNENTSPEGGGWRSFTLDLDEPVNGSYYFVCPYAGEELGVQSNVVQFKQPHPVITGVAPTFGRTGAELTLTGSLQGDAPFSYNWDFGGAGTPSSSTAASPVVTLGDPGEYQASLTVTNAFGEDTHQFELTVNPNQPPQADISPLLSSGNAPFNATLYATGSSDDDGIIVSYEWDWDGNGSWDSGPNGNPVAQHTYSESSTYFPMVRVTDDCGATDTASATVEVSAAGSWNFLVWIAADNDLGQAGFDDITEMEVVGSTEDVTILVGYDIDPEYCDPGLGGIDKVHFMKVVQDSNPNAINTNGDPANVHFERTGYNSADPANLVAFLDWAEANHPAGQTALVLWDHGSGWRVDGDEFDGGGGGGAKRRGTSRQASGVLGDDTDGSFWSLTPNAAIVAALEGRYFDILAFDACNMGDIESLYEYYELAGWIIASEASVPFDGFAYLETLTHWNEQLPDIPTIGSILVDDYIARYAPDEWEEVQLALYDCSVVPTAVAALGSFAAGVEAQAESEADYIKGALNDAYDPWGEGTRDLLDFLGNYRGLTSQGGLITLSNAATAACESLVVYTAEHQMAGTQGVSAFLPDDYYWVDYLLDEYDGLPFNQATGWLDMLNATIAPEPPPEYDWVPGDRLVVSWFDPLADFDLGVTDPSGYTGYPYWPEPVYGNIEFSLDSEESGFNEEWARLMVGAEYGGYTISVEWYEYYGYDPPSTIDVRLRLYNNADILIHDFGTVALGMWEIRDVLLLRYD